MKSFSLGSFSLGPICLLLVSLAGSRAMAQTISGGNAFATPSPGLTGLTGLSDGADASASPGAEKKKPEKAEKVGQAPQGPTVIDSDSMDYDEKTRVAVFTGDNYGVFVKDPQFTVNCNKLTAFMRKAAGASAPGTPGAPRAKGKAAAAAGPKASPGGKRSAPDTAAAKSGGLQRALAEGNADQPVVIVQEKPATNGEQAQHNVGIAEKADYNADTGDVVLTGWPRVSQGINTQIATSKDTIMTMNRDGHTMKTKGPSRSIIQEQDQPKKTGTAPEAADETPAPTP
jgi:lipopolysaccharide export system protein LptA